MLNILTHFKELKLKMRYACLCFICTYGSVYCFMPQLVNIISTSYIFFVKGNNFDFVFANIFEVFDTYIIFSLHSTFFLSTPVIFYFSLHYAQPGFFLYEKKFLFQIFTLFLRLLFISCLLCHFFLIPFILFFLSELSVVNDMDFIILKTNMNFYSYVISISKFFFTYCYGIFQIPVLFSTFVFFKDPSCVFFFRLRRLWLSISFFFGCIFSSSDFISFVLTSFFLLLFFEVFVFLSVLKDRYLLITACRELLEW